MDEKLEKGQIIYINEKKYEVLNMIEFKERGWIWQEYGITDEEYRLYPNYWLTVEKNEDNEIEYYLYQNYIWNIDTKKDEMTIDNMKYKVYEEGTAKVKDYFGNADVDIYERCVYKDYISEDKKTIISIENWDGEIEKTKGTYIDKGQIRVAEKIDNGAIQMKPSRGFSTLGIGFLIIILMIYIIQLTDQTFFGSFTNKSIENYLEKETTKYTYITSVTNNENNQKAKVYKSTLSSLDETVKDIIDGVPEGIKNTIDSDTTTEKDGIGLMTKKEYAYVYEEQKQIYVQVSKKKYVNSSGSTYHSSHSHYYHNSFTSTQKSIKYNNYANSARQSSINSRSLAGGGTSSGK